MLKMKWIDQYVSRAVDIELSFASPNEDVYFKVMALKQILQRFMEDFSLRRNFETQSLPNSKKLWISMQRAVLDTHTLYDVIGRTYSFKIS